MSCSYKETEIMVFIEKQVQLENIMLSKASQTDSERKYHIFSHILNLNLKCVCVCVFTCVPGGHETSHLRLTHRNLFCVFRLNSRLSGFTLYNTDLLSCREW